MKAIPAKFIRIIGVALSRLDNDDDDDDDDDNTLFSHDNV